MAASTIVITYDGTDITDHCVFAETSFQGQMAAVPGTFTVVVRDTEQDQSFVTGKQIQLSADGVSLFGGYVMQVSEGGFVPVDDTVNQAPEDVKTRMWTLTGFDYNGILDKLILRNTANYTHDIPSVTGSPTDGDIIRDWFDNYFDIPSGFDFTTFVGDSHTFSTTGKYTWMTQGATMRQVLENLALYGAVFWIDADKALHYLPVQDTVAPWGFSDLPNNDPIGVGTPTYGFRDGEFTEDASTVVNDALVWGGSEWAVGGDVVFARQQNSSSISDHGRWQVGEVRVGEANYKIQSEVTARAKVIVNGTDSGTDPANGTQSLANPERTFRCTWFSTGVPIDGGEPVHLIPGLVVPIRLYIFSDDGGVTPFAVDLPMRSMDISFPDNAPDGDSYIQFDGTFGLLMSDPVWLWKFLREGSTRTTVTTVQSSADDSSVDPPYGSNYMGVPTPATDGSTTVFNIPFGYIGGTVQLLVNGLVQATGAFTESDPSTGEITLSFAPISTDSLLVRATLSG